MTERSYVFRTQATSIRHRIVPDWIVALSNNHRPRARTFCSDRYSTRTFCNDRYRTRARTYRADRYPAQGQEPGTRDRTRARTYWTDRYRTRDRNQGTPNSPGPSPPPGTGPGTRNQLPDPSQHLSDRPVQDQGQEPRHT